MKKPIFKFAVFALLLLVTAQAMAQRLAYSGLDPSAHQGEAGAVPYAQNLVQWAGGSDNPNIAYVNTSNVQGLLTTAGFTNLTEISVNELDTADLSGFDLLWVGRITNDSDAAAVAAAEANVQAYYNGGGNIVTEDQRQEPNSYDWLPFGDNLDPETIDANPVTIVEADHPTMNGLTGADLSGWGNSFHKVFNTPEVDGWLTVATNDAGAAVLIVMGEIQPPTPVPALGNRGLLILVLVLASLGAFTLRRRFAS